MKLFKRKTKKEKLQDLYKKKLAEAHQMSTSNRKRSDELVFEAEQIMKQIENEE